MLNNTEADLFYQHYFGWTHGAGGKPMEIKRLAHEDETMREAYEQGYIEGLQANRDASKIISKLRGYKPSVLRGADD